MVALRNTPVEAETETRGSLRVMLLEGRDLPAKGSGSMSACVVITVAELLRRRKQRSSICFDDRNPVWNEMFDFPDTPSDAKVVLDIWDKSGQTDEFIGKTIISVDQCRQGVPHVFYKNVIEGQVLVRLLFTAQDQPEHSPVDEEDTSECALESDSDEELILEKSWRYSVPAPQPGNQHLPWLQTMATGSGPVDSTAPDISLQLQFVHGYRGWDTRKNLFWSRTGKLVYNVAAVGVVFDPAQHRQQFFLGHVAPGTEVISTCLHPSRRYAATGETSSTDPKVLVWELDSREQLFEATCSDQGAVVAMAFSPNGKYLATVGADATLCIWAWRGSRLAAETRVCNPSQTTRVFSVEWAEDTTLVTVGVQHIKFWSFTGTGKLRGRAGTMLPGVSLHTLICACRLGSNRGSARLLTGTAKGHLYMWAGSKMVTKRLAAHDGPIHCITEHGTEVLTVGADGWARFWDSTLQLLNEVHLPAVGRSVDCFEERIVVGTCQGAMYEIVDDRAEILQDSHHPGDGTGGKGMKGELRALAFHPKKSLFASGAGDCSVRFWDSSSHQCTVKESFDSPVQALAWSPNGDHLFVGFSTGQWQVVNASTFESVGKADFASNGGICIGKFAPQADMLAVGMKDGQIHIYSTSTYRLNAVCKGAHSQGIVQLDWSSDGQHLQSVCSGSQLKYWRRDGSEVHESSSMKRVSWACWTCPAGWPVEGLASGDRGRLMAVQQSANGQLLAAAYDTGMVQVVRWPCCDVDAAGIACTGHGGNVADVGFNPKDACLVSIGSHDHAIMQWGLQLK